MQQYVKLIFLFLFFSCSTPKKNFKAQPNSSFKIVKTSFGSENGTITINELQFYKVRSAFDGMKLMYLNYGKWNERRDGKHQNNINQFVWKKINLLENGETFTIIADGIETKSNYYSSIIVIDSNNSDCFDKNHPLRNQLTNLFISKMKNLNKESFDYKIFR